MRSPEVRPGSRRDLLALLPVICLSAALVLPPLAPPGGTGGRALPTLPALAGSHAPDLMRSAAISALPRPQLQLAYDGISPTAISLNWSASNDPFFSNYTVALSSNSSAGPWSTVGVVTSRATTVLGVGALQPGGSYWWRVTEWGVVGQSPSNVISVGQPTPAYLTHTLPSASSARFNWTNNASYGGALQFVSYTLLESDSGGAFTPVATVTNAAVTTALVTGLSSGTSYQFYLNTTDCFSGCGGGAPSSAVSASNAVTIGTPLPLSASITVVHPVVDLSQSDLFTCTPSGGQSPYRFAWQLGNGSFANGSNSRGVQFAAPGNLTVTCRITDALASGASAATTVLVNPDPTIAVQLNRSTSDVGQAIAFTCVISQGSPPYATAWAFGDGSSQPGGLAVHSYAGAGPYVPTCSASDSAGAVVAGSALVRVSPALVATAQSAYPGAAPNSSLPFTAVATGGSGNYTAFAWDFGDGGTALGASVSHAFRLARSYLVSVAVTDSNGVTVVASRSAVIARLTATVSPLPTSLSVGASLRFSASALGGAGGYNFTWSFGDGTTAYGPNLTHAYHSSGTVRPLLYVRDLLGAGANVTLAPLSVTPPPPPNPLLSAAPLLVGGVLAGIAIALIAWGLERRRVERQHGVVAGYIPSVDPDRAIAGVKVCRACGTANVPVRSSCTHCGAPLPG